MGMYTEMYLGVELNKDTREDIIKWLLAHDSKEYTLDDLFNLTPRELKDTRLDVLGEGSYYFDAQPHFHFKWDNISKTYFLTVGFNIKNYSDEISTFLKLIEPYILSHGHIGHVRHETEKYPTLLMMDEHQKITEVTPKEY